MSDFNKKQINIKKLLIKNLDTFNMTAILKIIKNKPTNLVIDALNDFDDIKNIILILLISKELKTRKLFMGLSFDIQKNILFSTKNNELKIIMRELWPDQILQLMNDYPQFYKKILLSLDTKTRGEIKKSSYYDDDEIGHIMNPEFISLNENLTISKCINILKKERNNVENINHIFVVNEDNILLGKVDIDDLVFAEKYSSKLKSIIDTSLISIKATEDIEQVIQMFDKYSIHTLAVINSKGQLIGFIQDNDIISILQEEATEDIYKMYGMSELSSPYLHSSITSIIKSRLLWLTILMISATITSIIIDQFQLLSEELTAGISSILLIPLLPVLTGTSGNAGSQSSASIIRSLSIGDIGPSEYRKAIFKEFKVGLLIGLILAFINILRLSVYNAIFWEIDGQTFNRWEAYQYKMAVAGSSSFALFISIVLSKLLGSCLPILALKLKKDPTVMSAPILATILDVISTTLLFSIGIGIIRLLGIV